MARYVKAAAVKSGMVLYGFHSEDQTVAEFVEDILPTADVVEVVRCKDCKYMCHYTDGHLECRLLSDLKPIPTTYCTMNADDFCSYGERREDDTPT